MKKVLSTLLVAGMFAFYACGPSAEEKAAADAAAQKATQDSIDALNAAAAAIQSGAAMADSVTMTADSTAK